MTQDCSVHYCLFSLLTECISQIRGSMWGKWWGKKANCEISQLRGAMWGKCSGKKVNCEKTSLLKMIQALRAIWCFRGSNVSVRTEIYFISKDLLPNVFVRKSTGSNPYYSRLLGAILITSLLEAILITAVFWKQSLLQQSSGSNPYYSSLLEAIFITAVFWKQSLLPPSSGSNPYYRRLLEAILITAVFWKQSLLQQ